VTIQVFVSRYSAKNKINNGSTMNQRSFLNVIYPFDYLFSFIYLAPVFFSFSLTKGLTNEQSLSLVSKKKSFLEIQLTKYFNAFRILFCKTQKRKNKVINVSHIFLSHICTNCKSN